MLIVFVATQDAGATTEIPAPALPDLHIQDSETGAHIPVAGLEGWDADFLQAQTVCFAPMDFQQPETGKVAGDVSLQYWCRRLSRMLLRASFSDAGASATFIPLYYDKDGVESLGDPVTVTATSRMDGSLYMGRLAVIDTYGADKMAVLVESVSAGTVNLALAGV